jgi:hypothetical protein
LRDKINKTPGNVFSQHTFFFVSTAYQSNTIDVVKSKTKLFLEC